MIVQRYEKGIKFLDLERYSQRSMDEDDHVLIEEHWECIVYENGDNPDIHDCHSFASETMARMFIDNNGWKEQVL